MMTVTRFVFNTLQENTYVVSDETREAVVIDCGALYDEEREELLNYIKNNHLKPVHLLSTHGHFDHNFGNDTIWRTFGLKNCQPEHLRGEDEKGKYDFVVSRAVMPLPDLVKIVRKNIEKRQQNAMGNGVFCLKGGELQAEIQPFRHIVEVNAISNWFAEEWFKEKSVIYLPL